MLYSLPSDSFVITQGDIPTGLSDVGVAIVNASTGSVALARTTTGVTERPSGSGIYVATLKAPATAGYYIVVLDWGSPPTPSTTRHEDLSVTLTIPAAPSGLGALADSAHARMGETFDRLRDSDHYGDSYILLVIQGVKERLMTAPPATSDEDDLPKLVQDYLGKLVALDLMPAAFDYWASQVSTKTVGESPTEVLSYPDRIRALERVQESLLLQTRRDAPLVEPMIDSPRLATASGPAIDEPTDDRVTRDPRDFPPYHSYPFPRDQVL